MSNILRRPMFRRGGAVESKGQGITSGLDTPKRGLVDEPGKYSQPSSIDQAISMYSDTAKAMPFDFKPELSFGDYLRIASRGAEIVGAPSEGSGLGGVLATASKPLAKLGMELGTGIDKRQALAKKTYQDRVGAVAKLAGGLEEEKIKANRTFAKKQNLELFESKMNERIASLTEKRDSYDEGSEEYLKFDKLIKIETQNRNDGMTSILTGSKTEQEQKRELFKIFITNADGDIDEAIASFMSIFPDSEMDTIYSGFTAPTTRDKKKPVLPKATGGRVGMFAGGPMTGGTMEDEMVEEALQDEAKQLETLNKKNQKQQAQPLTYDQLRTRLPRSIGDDIVRLLADNYDALGDFASIQTQADVDNFNLKYQVNLVLPQEA